MAVGKLSVSEMLNADIVVRLGSETGHDLSEAELEAWHNFCAEKLEWTYAGDLTVDVQLHSGQDDEIYLNDIDVDRYHVDMAIRIAWDAWLAERERVESDDYESDDND